MPGYADIIECLNAIVGITLDVGTPYLKANVIEVGLAAAIRRHVDEFVTQISNSVGLYVGASIEAEQIETARLEWMTTLPEDLRVVAANLLFWGTLDKPVLDGNKRRSSTVPWMAKVLTGGSVKAFISLVAPAITFEPACPVCGEPAIFRYDIVPHKTADRKLSGGCSNHSFYKHNGHVKFDIIGFDADTFVGQRMQRSIVGIKQGMQTLSAEGSKIGKIITERVAELSRSDMHQTIKLVGDSKPSQVIVNLMRHILSTADESHNVDLHSVGLWAAHSMLLAEAGMHVEEAILRLAASGAIVLTGVDVPFRSNLAEHFLHGAISMTSSSPISEFIERIPIDIDLSNIRVYYYSHNHQGDCFESVRVMINDSVMGMNNELRFDYRNDHHNLSVVTFSPKFIWEIVREAAPDARGASLVTEIVESPIQRNLGDPASMSAIEEEWSPRKPDGNAPRLYVLVNNSNRWEGPDHLFRLLPKFGSTGRDAKTRSNELGSPTGVAERFEVFWEMAHPKAWEIEDRFKKRHEALLTTGQRNRKKEFVKMMPEAVVAQFMALITEIEAEDRFIHEEKEKLRPLFETGA